MVILGRVFNPARRRGLSDRIVSGARRLEVGQRGQDDNGDGQMFFRMDRVSPNQLF